jgi:CopG family nickel-responsive transcriptional regulator
MEVTNMTRIAMTIPQKLLNDFDECLKKNGFTSRTNGIHEAMYEYMERLK